MVIYVMNDIFKSTPNNCIMVQSVNCMGVMGAGLAKAIRDRYPIVYEIYKAEYDLEMLELGYVSYIDIEEGLIVANLCGQYGYGREKRHTNYDALRTGFTDIKDMAQELAYDIVIPKNIGCGLGGGDWKVVSKMLDEIFDGELIAYIYEEGDEDNEYIETEEERTSWLSHLRHGESDEW